MKICLGGKGGGGLLHCTMWADERLVFTVDPINCSYTATDTYEIITYLELCDENNGHDGLDNTLWIRADYVLNNARVHKSQATGCHGDYILYSGASYLWVCSVGFASCHATGT